MPEDKEVQRFCPHCGTLGTTRLGPCEVCGLTVCLKCGNTQFISGSRKIIHNECLHKAGDGFSMIKIIR